ncbi:MAG: BMP family ABC transporter substrate-binding protein [Chloroflexi bacterium]|nr:BMP family ABC transporter substrate-binding protein [Chloroflexota bacterium]
MRHSFHLLTVVVLLSLMVALVGVGCAPAAPAPTATPAKAPVAAATPTKPPAAAPTPAPTPTKKLVFAMVTDQSGLGDQGFNDLAYAGLKMAEKEFGSQTKVVESREQAQYVPNLTGLAQQKVDLIVGVGFLLVDSMKEVAPQFKNSHFALVDAEVDAPNVASLLFKEQEGAFLGGAVAGLLTKSNKIGFVGGMEIPPVVRFQAGFQAGIKTTNPNAEVLIGYVGSFADPAKGKEMALSQFAKGADIIFEVAGGGGVGVFSAAKEKGKGFWVIAVDRDKSNLAPDNHLTAVVKRVDSAVADACKGVATGTFKGGVHQFGLKDGGMGLAESKYIPADVMQKVAKLKEMVIGGQVVPPKNLDELKTFTPPKL